MNKCCSYILIIMLFTLNEAPAQNLHQEKLSWKTLPSIPDDKGFAGSFAGTSGAALLVAGGANFPDGLAPWSGGVKTWTDQVFALEPNATAFKMAGKLPRPLGYGASVQWGDRLLLIGGSNAGGHYSDVLVLAYAGGKFSVEKFPDLPKPLANLCAARCGNLVYVAGGLLQPDSKAALKQFLVLDLQAPGKGWKELPAWPGPARMLAVAGAVRNTFYLFSGVELADGNRRYLKDAYAYDAHTGWKKLADLPSPVAAAASPAFTDKSGALLIFGGDDGSLAPKSAELKERHPGFSDAILQYDPAKNCWKLAGHIPTQKLADADRKPNKSTWAPVTTTLAEWQGAIVLPGGEVRPAVRTPQVRMAVPVKTSIK
ncbi:galactose oxidase [Pedobacter yulinensis]|uniref:Galactose oxidase n=1 Tax=Pedobacter yulinensis TaxID=2126353 RepID=A0A2T3HMB0_9SPHI|nr:galactose oxidase [Pedobacter yulinensis]PST83569.1 galactose oxidase [Pedobacter yulinensis]